MPKYFSPCPIRGIQEQFIFCCQIFRSFSFQVQNWLSGVASSIFKDIFRKFPLWSENLFYWCTYTYCSIVVIYNIHQSSKYTVATFSRTFFGTENLEEFSVQSSNFNAHKLGCKLLLANYLCVAKYTI